MSSDSIEGKMFVTFPAPWPVTIREVSVDDGGAVIDEIKTLRDGILASPLDHIVARPDDILAIAKHACSAEEFARVSAEIEALVADATPTDLRAEFDATPIGVVFIDDAVDFDAGRRAYEQIRKGKV